MTLANLGLVWRGWRLGKREGVLGEVPKLQTLMSNYLFDISWQGSNRLFRLNIFKTKILFFFFLTLAPCLYISINGNSISPSSSNGQKLWRHPWFPLFLVPIQSVRKFYWLYLQNMSRIQLLYMTSTVSEFGPSHQHYSTQESEWFCKNVSDWNTLWLKTLRRAPLSLTKSQRHYNGLQHLCVSVNCH